MRLLRVPMPRRPATTSRPLLPVDHQDQRQDPHATTHFAPVGQLLREWRATAEIHADPRLARRLRADIAADGGVVPAPQG